MDAIIQFLPYVAIFAVFWLLLIRPQQKRARELQERQESLTPGTRVMTTAGIFGTVRHVGEKQLVIEVSPGVEMTVIKGAIAKTVSADEDEFEYEADADAAALPASDADGFDDAIAGYHAESAPDPLAPRSAEATTEIPDAPRGPLFDPTKPADDERPGSTKA